MKTNESTIDRSFRLILGGFLLILSVATLGVTAGEPLGIVAAAVGAILVITAAIGFCPAYTICGISTRKSCCGDGSCNTAPPTDTPA